jgi:hypothetical protein
MLGDVNIGSFATERRVQGGQGLVFGCHLVKIHIDDRFVHRFGQGGAHQTDIDPVVRGLGKVGTINTIDENDLIGIDFVNEIFLDVFVLQTGPFLRQDAKVGILKAFEGCIFPSLLLFGGKALALEVLHGRRTDVVYRMFDIDIVLERHKG